MLTKKDLNKVINDLPDTFTFDDVLDRILLLQKIEIGLEQSTKNEVITDDDLSKKLPEWLH
jgi:hypothetical protein